MKRFVAGALLVAVAFPSAAQSLAGSALDPSPTSASVAAYYSSYSVAPIWFRNGTADIAAITRLTALLQRAPFDGFPAGPQLAAQVQSAIVQASSGRAQDVAAADRILSSAWVQYVQAIKRPTG